MNQIRPHRKPFIEKREEVKRKVIFRNFQSPGDILMLTAAVRDLKLSYPDILVDVRTSAPEIWENNPYLTKLDEKEAEVFDVGYPIIHNSNEGAYHFIHGFRLDIEDKLRIKIKSTKFKADIHFSKEELSWISMIHEHFTHEDTPFWLICSGGKKDYSCKWWIPEYAQEVVDYFKGKIQFVQFGQIGDNHYHPPLQNVINLVGKTDLRMFMRLAYHSDGIICPITFAMHLAAALPQKPGKPINKPCIVTAGGREPCTFTRYTHHDFLHTNGLLDCCQNGGCWKSRVTPFNDGDKKNTELCLNPVVFNGRKVQKCMYEFITPKEVINSIEKHYKFEKIKYFKENKQEIIEKYDINNLPIGCLIFEEIKFIYDLIIQNINTNKKINILEIGTYFGKSAIGLGYLLKNNNIDFHIDSVDTFMSSIDFPEKQENYNIVKKIVSDHKMSEQINLVKVHQGENLINRLMKNKYDVVFIDGEHQFSFVYSDCFFSDNLSKKKNSIIIGDDWGGQVKDAVESYFCNKNINFKHKIWWVNK